MTTTVAQIQLRRGTAAAWTTANPTLAAGEPAYETDTGKVKVGNGTTAWNALAYLPATAKAELCIALGDESTAITATGNPKVTFRMPFAMTLTAVRASLSVASSAGLPTFDINEAGVSILSTKLSIDATEKTSTTAATPAVISDANLADDAEITIDVDVAGTGAAGPKVWLIGYRTA